MGSGSADHCPATTQATRPLCARNIALRPLLEIG